MESTTTVNHQLDSSTSSSSSSKDDSNKSVGSAAVTALPPPPPPPPPPTGFSLPLMLSSSGMNLALTPTASPLTRQLLLHQTAATFGWPGNCSMTRCGTFDSAVPFGVSEKGELTM